MPKVIAAKRVPKGAINVGPGTPWANPFITGEHGNRDEVLQRFHDHVVASKALLRRVRKELRGRDLVCACGPRACHAHVLLALANGCPLPSVVAQQQLLLPAAEIPASS